MRCEAPDCSHYRPDAPSGFPRRCTRGLPSRARCRFDGGIASRCICRRIVFEPENRHHHAGGNGWIVPGRRVPRPRFPGRFGICRLVVHQPCRNGECADQRYAPRSSRRRRERRGRLEDAFEHLVFRQMARRGRLQRGNIRLRQCEEHALRISSGVRFSRNRRTRLHHHERCSRLQGHLRGVLDLRFPRLAGGFGKRDGDNHASCRPRRNRHPERHGACVGAWSPKRSCSTTTW